MVEPKLVLIKGAGDLASGVAWRLLRCGFSVVMTEIERPLAVRRAVCFAQAIFDGHYTVEGVTGVRADLTTVLGILDLGQIPVLVDPHAESVEILKPSVVVDAIMAKRNTGLARQDAPLVIALGPGFTAGVDCHRVIETSRGHGLGRVLYAGSPQPDTGAPGPVAGHGLKPSRVLRAAISGYTTPHTQIGQRIEAGSIIATIRGPNEVESITAPFSGLLRGLIHPTVWVGVGMKIGDLDPRFDPDICFTISDKSLAVAGGVLEAILVSSQYLG